MSFGDMAHLEQRYLTGYSGVIWKRVVYWYLSQAIKVLWAPCYSMLYLNSFQTIILQLLDSRVLWLGRCPNLGMRFSNFEASLQASSQTSAVPRYGVSSVSGFGWWSFAALGRGISLTCFFNLMTLNRSKSDSPRLFSLCSRFFAHVLWSHFSSMPSFSQALATAPVPAARGSFGRTIGVRMTLAKEMAWRGTAAFSFEEGPSTKACHIF